MYESIALQNEFVWMTDAVSLFQSLFKSYLQQFL